MIPAVSGPSLATCSGRVGLAPVSRESEHSHCASVELVAFAASSNGSLFGGSVFGKVFIGESFFGDDFFGDGEGEGDMSVLRCLDRRRPSGVEKETRHFPSVGGITFVVQGKCHTDMCPNINKHQEIGKLS